MTRIKTVQVPPPLLSQTVQANIIAPSTSVVAGVPTTSSPTVATTAQITSQSSSTQRRGILQLLWDSIFGSDENVQTSQQTSVFATTPTQTSFQLSVIILSDLFEEYEATTSEISKPSSSTAPLLLSNLLGGLQETKTASTNSLQSTTATALYSVAYFTSTQASSYGDDSSSTSTDLSEGSDSASNSQVAEAISAAQGAKGITYSPYKKDGSCKTSQEVLYDLKKLRSFGLIRLYSTDCSGVENVLASMSSSQELFLGIYEIDSNTITTGLQTIKSAVEASSRGWSAVHTISVGNERVNDGKSSVSDLKTALDTTRTWLKTNAPSYGGYVVTVDTLTATVLNTGLCDISDYLAVNCHPFWDGGVEPSNSGTWLEQQIANLESACGSSKPILITESGWPTKGDTYGSCVPSLSNQVSALKSIMLKLSSQVFMFTMYNDYWKDPGPSNVEQHWGIYGDPAA